MQAAGVVPVLAFFAPAAEAVPPSYDGWTVTNGAINAPCPASAVSCGEPVTDNGFLMRKVTMAAVPQPNGFPALPQVTYYQYIVTEPGASGSPTTTMFAPGSLRFSNETISQANNGGSSVYDKTRMAESRFVIPSLEERVSQVATMSHCSGDSQGIGVFFDQKVQQIDWSGASPVELLNSAIKAAGRAAYGMELRHDSAFAIVVTEDINLGGTGVQKFQWQEAPDNRYLHAKDTINPILPGGTNGGDIPLEGQDKYWGTWVGQVGVNNTADTFGYVKYKTESVGQVLVSDPV
jgi:hypothetical protein